MDEKRIRELIAELRWQIDQLESELKPAKPRYYTVDDHLQQVFDRWEEENSQQADRVLVIMMSPVLMDKLKREREAMRRYFPGFMDWNGIPVVGISRFSEKEIQFVTAKGSAEVRPFPIEAPEGTQFLHPLSEA